LDVVDREVDDALRFRAPRLVDGREPLHEVGRPVRGQQEQALVVREGLLEGRGILEVADDRLAPFGRRPAPLSAARHDPNLLAPLEEAAHDEAPDRSCPAQDELLHLSLLALTSGGRSPARETLPPTMTDQAGRQTVRVAIAMRRAA